MSKATLRRRILTQRTWLRADPTELMSHICSYIRARRLTTVAAYTPTEFEPGGGLPLIDALASATETLYLPAVAPKHQLTWGTYRPGDALVPGAYNIPQPRHPNHPSTILNSCQLVLVPGLACTLSGVRLGRGGGFYDRALESVTESAVELAVLLYPGEILSDIPFESHDVRMHRIFTAEGTVTCCADV